MISTTCFYFVKKKINRNCIYCSNSGHQYDGDDDEIIICLLYIYEFMGMHLSKWISSYRCLISDHGFQPRPKKMLQFQFTLNKIHVTIYLPSGAF